MHIPAVSTDFIIVGAMVLVLVYGFVAGQSALIRESISIYVGLVLAAAFAQPLFDYIRQASSGNYAPTETMVRLILFGLPIVLLMFVHGRERVRHRTSPLVTTILSLASGLLLISSVLNQLDAITLGRITQSSNLASWIHDLQLVWIAIVPVAIAATAIIRPRERHH